MEKQTNGKILVVDDDPALVERASGTDESPWARDRRASFEQ
jgi:hypothetical protein